MKRKTRIFDWGAILYNALFILGGYLLGILGVAGILILVDWITHR